MIEILLGFLTISLFCTGTYYLGVFAQDKSFLLDSIVYAREKEMMDYFLDGLMNILALVTILGFTIPLFYLIGDLLFILIGW